MDANLLKKHPLSSLTDSLPSHFTPIQNLMYGMVSLGKQPRVKQHDLKGCYPLVQDSSPQADNENN